MIGKVILLVFYIGNSKEIAIVENKTHKFKISSWRENP
jgi:hypothetical protein